MDLQVGIVSGSRISFSLKSEFRAEQGGQIFFGNHTVYKENDRVFLEKNGAQQEIKLPLILNPLQEDAKFEIADVTIGIQFHWERKENQSFKGAIKLIEENDGLTLVNILDIEEYLLSVIASEMSATSSLELLKAHAVISRSWLLAQKEKSGLLQKKEYHSCLQNDTEYIRWYDREDHLHYDVCADDHCQRYQGVNKASTEEVREAVYSTRGEVLVYDKTICDTRFSKCCGGMCERFENVWEPVPHPYLKEVYDAETQAQAWDLTREEEATRWILQSPDVFCNTNDEKILQEVLNDYDRETDHFFRWEVYYSQEEISALIRDKINIDFGHVLELIPIERGVSGRLIRLKIIGSKQTRIIGKELLIRKALSPSHLYSSAFIVEKELVNGEIKGFRLKGAGWGHGVGLCQIGAAVMSSRGYTYKEILSHYYPETILSSVYN